MDRRFTPDMDLRKRHEDDSPRGYLQPDELPELDLDDVRQQEHDLSEKIREGFLL
jgi:hypothetical protein